MKIASSKRLLGVVHNYNLGIYIYIHIRFVNNKYYENKYLKKISCSLLGIIGRDGIIASSPIQLVYWLRDLSFFIDYLFIIQHLCKFVVCFEQLRL